ncbi:CAMK family protein kinase [Tritrichomonas foetus]|uniref:CAMK family protein kinase n=1 Tax=Tritrichomonas foetus TaxID=1144522 RepID=A0A1J4KLI1_9EUKA|nr:CAMK family protein kinase [Tritrichomonas foetus]|eukprot:OHT11800.1 CAMK family protein kinase [Tritrichomonas foetus]
MGCILGQPLPKPTGSTTSQLGDPKVVSSLSLSNAQNDEKLISAYSNSDEKGDDQQTVRTFFSFSSFILQNENPVIFEWHFLREIGKGSMSRVFLAQHIETGEMCAAKVYNKALLLRQTLGIEEPPFRAVQREIEIMAAISHRYVLPLIEVIEDDLSNSLIMLMPFADNGTLQSVVDSRQLTDENLAVCFHQIGEALRYVHSLNIVHRDIKPENILVFSDTFFSLSDFSVSTALSSSDEELVDTRGSPAFLSPEECAGGSFMPKPADVWAYGVSLYAAAFKKLPFNLESAQGKTVANTVFAVSQILKTEELYIPETASKGLRELLEWVLTKNVEKRPNFEELVNHWWFKEAREIDLINIEAEKRAKAEEEDTNEEEEDKEDDIFQVP